MANTLTGLIPTMYEALDVVSRELVGAIQAVSRDSSAAMAAKDQTVRSAVVPQNSAEDITPGADPADSGDQTISYVDVTISKSRAYPIRWTGEEELSVINQPNILRDQFAQGFRTLANEIESDLAGLHIYASRAYGTAATAPFGTANDLSDAANVRRILDDNGAPQTDLHLVLGGAAMANIRGKQSVLFKVNEAGTDALLRQGVIGELQGFMLHNSGQIKTFTAGTGASATTNAAGYAIGATTITLASAGTGTILAGDVITFAGDSNKYLVVTGDADVSNGGTVVLAAPGLRQAIAASATNITVVATSARNMAFSRDAIQLVTRAPAMPAGGDDADDITTVTDPISGLTFQVATYRQYRRRKIEIGMAWGYKVIKPAHLAVLLG